MTTSTMRASVIFISDSNLVTSCREFHSRLFSLRADALNSFVLCVCVCVCIYSRHFIFFSILRLCYPFQFSLVTWLVVSSASLGTDNIYTNCNMQKKEMYIILCLPLLKEKPHKTQKVNFRFLLLIS